MNPLTEPFSDWEFCAQDAQGNPINDGDATNDGGAKSEEEAALPKAPQEAQAYHSTAVGMNLRDSQKAVVVLELVTGQGREVDETFARFLLDAMRDKQECEFLLYRAKAAVEKHQQQQRRYVSGPLSAQVPDVLANYEDLATSAIVGVKHWRDDMVTYLRAMAMVAEMVGNGGTHAEKAARLRGMIEMIETTIQKLRNEEFDFNRSWWHTPDVFRSDFPVRRYQQRIHELETELAQARGEPAHSEPTRRIAPRPRSQSALLGDDNDSDPFADE